MRRTKHARSVEMELSLQFTALPPSTENTPSNVLIPAASDHTPASALQEFSRGILQAMNAQAQALERIADVLAGASSSAPSAKSIAKTPAASAANEDVSQLNAEIEFLHKEIKVLRGLMSSSEQIHQHDVEQLRKWLNRLGAAQGSQNSVEE
jgi:hypothetical protein